MHCGFLRRSGESRGYERGQAPGVFENHSLVQLIEENTAKQKQKQKKNSDGLSILLFCLRLKAITHGVFGSIRVIP